jgi:hypothetical protein
MAILDDIDYFKDGELSEGTIAGLVNEMIDLSNIGSPNIAGISLGINIPESDLSHLSLNGLTLEQHEEKYPQFHKSYIGYTKTSTKFLNLEPVNVLKSIGVTDPTQPLVELIKTMGSTISGLPSDINPETLVLQKLPEIMDPDIVSDFTNLLVNITANSDLSNVDTSSLETIFEIILKDYPTALESVEKSLKEDKTVLLSKLKTSAITLFSKATGSLSSESLNPSLDIFTPSFLGLDIENINEVDHLFSIGIQPPGILGFYLNFLKEMLKEIAIAIANFQIPVNALELIGKLKDGIDGLKTFMIDKVLGPIKKSLYSAWPDIEKYSVPICYFAGYLKMIIKIIIVAIVGILLGPGLVVFGIAKALELI